MRYVLAIVGMICSLYLLKYREKVGDLMGEASWMSKVGGVYNIVIIVAIILFFWSVAYLTGTEDIFLKPVFLLLPGLSGSRQNSSNGPDFSID